MLTARKEEICRLICEEVAKPKPTIAAFAAMAQLKISPVYNHEKGRPIGSRSQAKMSNLADATGVSRQELQEFRDTLTPEMLARIKESVGKVWRWN